MNKHLLILPVLCLYASVTLAATDTQPKSIFLAQSTQPEGDGTRVDDRTERRIERRTAMQNATPEERAARREERRAKAAEAAEHIRSTEGGARRIERRQERQDIRQQTRNQHSN